MRRLHLIGFAAVVLASVIAVGTTRGEVRIVEDEVVFSVRAPGAKNVFLVGDFNNWNATLEKMENADDRFEIKLLLLPGTYRYKFVVDGNWISDPDHPPADPSQGSPLVLVERVGVLMFGTDEKVEAGKVGETLKSSLRYTGALLLDDGDTDSHQTLDVWVSHTNENVSAEVDLKTIDESWDVSPLRAEVLFDRGHIDVKIGDALLKGFENDSVWTSSDPFSLFGRLGVYDYNAGFERHGVSVEMPLILNVTLRALYSDKIGERPGPPARIGSEALGNFAGSDTPDTLVYRYRSASEDEDTWGLELLGDTGSFKFGYVKRGNRGFQSGTLAEVARTDSTFETSIFATREFWDADVGWLKWRFVPRLSAVLGLGRSEMEVRTGAHSESSVPTDEGLRALAIGQTTEESDRTIPIQTSKRWSGALEFETERSRAGARYSWSEYEFERGVYTPSHAVVSEFLFDAAHEGERWRAVGSLRYIDQDYGETPADFHLWTPERNLWLDHRDALTVGHIAAFGLEKTAQIDAAFFWNRRVLSNLARAQDTGRTAVVASGGLVSRGFFETIEYGYLRLGVEHTFARRLFAQWDSRVARYHTSSGVEDTFFSTYLEGGFRNGWTEVSVGFGLDPVVLDPVVNDYADIGREEYLREAIPAGFTRDQAGVLGGRLRERENSLEGYRVVKLEVILLF
jgi:hypothetical protein